ncbi:MAG: hypothetical protein HZB13_21900 [Acidobacteria bacterium]|nr:hypothetical protein [Acidobacteriota bacterium]
MKWRAFLNERFKSSGAWLDPVAGVSVFLLGVALTLPALLHHDVWHQMALAREVVATSRFPTADSFAYTPTVDPVVHHEWGAGLIVLLLAKAGGGPALALYNLCLVGAIAVLLARNLSACRVPLLVALPAAAFPIGIGVLSFPAVVAQAYSALACALLLLFLQRDDEGSRGWIAPWLAVCALWVNVHGGMVIGFAMLGAHAIEQAARGRRWGHLAATMAGMLAVILLNPYGLSYYGYVLNALTMSRPVITEWNPKWLVSEFSVRQVAFLASIWLAAVVVRREGWRKCEGLLIVAVLAVVSVRATKALPFYAMAWLIAVPRAISRTALGEKARRLACEEARALAVVLLTVAAISCWGLVQRRFWIVRIPGVPLARTATILYPVGPVDYLQTHAFQGNMMTDFMDGSYVSWKLQARVKVGCDSRYEAAYPPEFVENVVRMYRSGDLKILKDIALRHPTDLVLARAKEPLSRTIEAQGEWRKVYEDDGYNLFARPGLALPYQQRKGELIMGSIP